MNTQTKTAMLAILCIGMLTALTLSTLTLAVNPAFAKKKHCDKTDNGCDAIKSEKNQDESKKTSADETTRSQAEIDNSTLPIASQSENPFALVGIIGINITN
ncbi:MAG: hypothetical protein ABJB85_09840 [Nitrososphaerota archaeon]